MKSYQWPAQMPHDPCWSRCISIAHSGPVSIQHPHCSGIYTMLLKYLSAHSRIPNLSKQKAPESGSHTQKNKCMVRAAKLLESVCIPVNNRMNLKLFLTAVQCGPRTQLWKDFRRTVMHWKQNDLEQWSTLHHALILFYDEEEKHLWSRFSKREHTDSLDAKNDVV